MNHLNLLSRSFQRRALLRRRIRQWLVIWILGLCGAGSVGAAGYWATKSDRRRLAELNAKCAPLRLVEQNIQRMEARLDEINGRESLLQMLDCADRPVQLIGIVSRATGGDVQDVYVEMFSLFSVSHSEIVESTDQDGRLQQTRVTREVMQLNLEGLGVDDLAVSRFVASLREADVFDQVLLKSSTEDTESSEGDRRFLVDCRYR